jgi:hypothetical protein
MTTGYLFAGTQQHTKRHRNDEDNADHHDARSPKRQKRDDTSKPRKFKSLTEVDVLTSIQLKNADNKRRAKKYKAYRERKEHEAESRRRHRLLSPSPEPLNPDEQRDLAHPEADKYGRRPSMFELTCRDEVLDIFGQQYTEEWDKRRRAEYLVWKAEADEMERIRTENLIAELVALKASDRVAYKARVFHLRKIGRYPDIPKPAARKHRLSADARRLRVQQSLDRRSSEPEEQPPIASDTRHSRAARAAQAKARATRKRRLRGSPDRSPSSGPRFSRSPSPHMTPVSLSPATLQPLTDMVIDSIEAPLLEELDSGPVDAHSSKPESTSKRAPKKALKETPKKAPKKTPNKTPKKAPQRPPPVNNGGSNAPPALESGAPVPPTQLRRSTRQQRCTTAFYQLDQRGKAQLA